MMKKTAYILSILVISLTTSCNKKSNEPKGDAEFTSLHDSFSYMVGLNYGFQLRERLIKEINFDVMVRGLKEGMTLDSNFALEIDLHNDIVGRHLNNLMEQLAEVNVIESKEFISEVAKYPGIQKNANGLLWKVIKQGQGPVVNITDSVQVHIEISFPDGEIFDDSRKYENPILFPVKDAFPGLVEGLQLMNKGSIYEFYVPYELAFGRYPKLKNIPPNKAIVYNVELIDIR
jgi:FKBP-type peptidyl-prolyl cis-trans isomerase